MGNGESAKTVGCQWTVFHQLRVRDSSFQMNINVSHSKSGTRASSDENSPNSNNSSVLVEILENLDNVQPTAYSKTKLGGQSASN